MIDPAHVPDIGPDEIVARYILFSKHIRPSNQTVKPDAFIPHPYPDLSVTRHLMANEVELWQVGVRVAAERSLTLHGRADVSVGIVRGQNLEILPDPIEGNPNHSNVRKWPPEKHEQKIIALELSKDSVFRPTPATAPAEGPAPAENPGPNVHSAGWFAGVKACWRLILRGVSRLRAVFRKKSH